MKKTILNIAAIVMLLFVAIAANAAGNVTFVKMLDGEKYTGADSNLATFSAVTQKGDGIYSFSITPTDDYYIGDVTAVKLIDAGQAQSRKNEPGFNPSVEIWTEDNTNWSFELSEADAAIYDVEVTVNFNSKTDISDAVVTLTLPADGYTYSGVAYEPEVTLVKLGDLEIESDYYDLDYSNNTAAGTATVTVTGKDIYKGAATATFTINKAALDELSVIIQGWTYGQYNEEVNAPRVDGNSSEGAVTYTYATYVVDTEPSFSETVPTNAGSYIVKATVAETDNYAAGEATANFDIDKADINPSVDLLGWVYGNTPNTPTVTGNTGNGEVTYTYAVDNASPEYTGTMPSVVGDYIVKATFAETSNYNGAEATDTFLISKANLADVVIDDIAEQTYTGSALTPAITVTFKGNPVDASEYTATYSDNENVGEATVTLTTKNVNFKDGETAPSKTFQIVPATVVVTAENQDVIYNGMSQEFDNYNYEAEGLEVLPLYFASEEERAKEDGEQLEVVEDAGTYYVKLVPGDDNYTFAPVYATFTIEPKSIGDITLTNAIDGDNPIAFNGEPVVFEEGTFGLRFNDIEYDLVENEDFTVAYENNDKVGTATVTLTGQGNYTGELSFPFDIARNLEINFDGHDWVTYYGAENLETPDGLKAYKVTVIGATEVTTEELGYIPANTAVLLKKIDGEVVESYLAKAYTEATSEVTDNLLLGASTGIDVTTISTGVVYVLYNDEFVKTISGEIPAGRGYLVVASSAAPNGPEARALTITIDEKATGITTATVAAKADGKYYNLQGQRMAQPRKGLNIVNGKKFMVK